MDPRATIGISNSTKVLLSFVSLCLVGILQNGTAFANQCEHDNAKLDFIIEAEVGSLELADIILDYQYSGGDGVAFKSTYPDLLGGGKTSYFLITKLPLKADPEAAVWMLREKRHLEILREMLETGVPILLGEIPASTRVGAVVTSEYYQCTRDALQVLKQVNSSIHHEKFKDARNTIMVSANVREATINHEWQHWRDYQNMTLRKKIHASLEKIVTLAPKLKDHRTALERLIYEIRGHSIAAKKAKDNAQGNSTFIDRAGNIIRKKSGSDHMFEMQYEENLFMRTYQHALGIIKSAVPKRKFKTVLAELSKYDFSDDPGFTLTFHRIYSATD